MFRVLLHKTRQIWKALSITGNATKTCFAYNKWRDLPHLGSLPSAGKIAETDSENNNEINNNGVKIAMKTTYTNNKNNNNNKKQKKNN
ncbi:hypothetical protein Y032_0002g874 [Ancylostoma ceylanicum]|uniref:Uncharacterized protein n=1 Tax=Ancylostoma ceylanicum TaxID=53326 RepID=A0A016W3N9_9BILA|nr:hypothetical protein Y032_0002g874 [Ancylostoma ceylanicum]